MNTYTLKTGFAYSSLNGVVIGKYAQAAGDQVILSPGIMITDVPNQSSLDAVTIPPTPDQVAAALLVQIKANRDAYVDAVIAGDTATQTAITTAQAALITQAVAANVPLPATTASFAASGGAQTVNTAAPAV